MGNTDFDTMTKAKIVEFAKNEDIKLDAKLTKAEMIEKLTSELQSKAIEAENKVRAEAMAMLAQMVAERDKGLV
jgi:alpha-acetolactate decarboxylase